MLDTKHEISSFPYQESESRIRSERMNMADLTFIQMSLTKLQECNLAAFKQDICRDSVTPFYTQSFQIFPVLLLSFIILQKTRGCYWGEKNKTICRVADFISFTLPSFFRRHNLNVGSMVHYCAVKIIIVKANFYFLICLPCVYHCPHLKTGEAIIFWEWNKSFRNLLVWNC